MTERMADVGGIQICYETFGKPDATPLLLIMGLGGQMVWWDEAFCQQLADRGFFVIRYDNRDTGRSSSMTGRVSLPRTFLRLEKPPYGLHDMADDAVGLLDHLGIDAAHVAGMSMGGMIAQTLAIRHPARVSSLTSIMSTTGNRLVGWQSPRAFLRLFGRRARNRDEYLRQAVQTWRVLSGGLPLDEARIRRLSGASFDRGLNPAGYFRHIGAIVSAPDRTKALAGLRLPAVVIHGTKDPLVNSSGGRATARAIPGAELLLIPGMGHDLHPSAQVEIADAIAHTAARASADSSPIGEA